MCDLLGGGGLVSKMGKGIFWATIGVCGNCPSLNFVEFECLGDLRFWGGGVVPKQIREVVVQ